MKISAFVLMLLASACWLMADVPDPTIRLSIPGTGTFNLCDVAAAGDSCSITLMDGAPDTTFGDDGFGHFAVKNIDQNGLAIDSISFFFQTFNLNQPFSAFTDDFTTVGIVKHSNFCIGDICHPTLEVDFSGVAKPGDAGSASVGPVFCEGVDCPTGVGFIPHSDVFVTAHFNVVPDPLPCCDGIQPGEEAGVSATSDVPEPGSLVLLLGAAGLLAVKRRFTLHRN